MPLFAIHCLDKPGAGDLRRSTRPQHLAFLEGLGAAIFLAGPLIDLDGQPMGSLLIVEVESRRAAYAIAADDPYSLAGLFQSVAVTEWRQVLPKPA
ncbi:MAG: YciI family protein [Sphingomonadaceae bacterium]|nr:YciI family protein [Sphingomonadaceae bacterium]